MWCLSDANCIGAKCLVKYVEAVAQNAEDDDGDTYHPYVSWNIHLLSYALSNGCCSVC